MLKNNPYNISDLPFKNNGALFYKKFWRKQAIPRLINLSFQFIIHPSLLQKTPVKPFNIVLIYFPLDNE